jgi:hypothetical protein
MADQKDRFQAWSRKKRIAVKLLLIISGILTGLLITEIALRVVGYSYPEFYTTDAARGYALRPGVEGWYRKEGKTYVRINSAGLRDIEHAKQKPANTLRIALLGDSYAEALQVPLENAFWYVMAQRLEECQAFAGKKIEVINFGVSGYGTAQELLTLRQQVWDYSPDIVLLTVTTNNDITDNSRVLKKTDQVPYFIYRDGQLVPDNSFQQTKTFRLRQSILGRLGAWLMEHLRVIQAVNHALYAFKHYELKQAQNISLNIVEATASAAATEGEKKTVTGEEIGIDNMVYLPPNNPVWNDAWRVTEGLIVLMREEVKSRGAQFLVVTLSNWIQVFPEVKNREAFMQRVGTSDVFYPDRRIRALCEREAIPVITLATALQTYAEQHQVFLHGFGEKLGGGHWNQLGHRVAGETLAREMCDVLRN